MTGADLDTTDRAIVLATQAGLPLVPLPYDAVAATVGIPRAELIARLERMLATGAIRRIGLVPNHYALGLRNNAMTVWDIDDAEIGRLGPAVGALDFVTHCYQRPRSLPHWPYNLFAMVHGQSTDEIASKTEAIGCLLGTACRNRETLVSTRILKKTGLRFAA
jgi:DNA-binding Lrp family transcriptional regulator